MTNSKQAKREAKRLLCLCRRNSVIEESRVRQVVQQLTAPRRRDSKTILEHFLRLLRLDCAQHTAYVESATPLPPELQAVTEADLVRVYGPGLTTSFLARPSLIGGMRIQIGSDVYDGSVLAGLAALERCF